MIRSAGLLKSVAALIVVLLPGAVMAAGPSRFDGNWFTTVSCAGIRDALGYNFRFTSSVSGGVLHGVYGSPGQPSSLQIDGAIGPDGRSRLLAQGHTGSREYVPGRDTPRGSPYSYFIDAQFNGSSGTGSRVEGRSCTVAFTRQ